MPWQTVPGLTGKVYVPEFLQEGKKHPCKDCFACQNCSEERCRVCRKNRHGQRRPRSSENLVVSD